MEVYLYSLQLRAIHARVLGLESLRQDFSRCRNVLKLPPSPRAKVHAIEWRHEWARDWQLWPVIKEVNRWHQKVWLCIRTCKTIVGLCSCIRSMIVSAALRRDALEDLEATVRGYISACGWCFPTSPRRLLIYRRILAWGVWIRAII